MKTTLTPTQVQHILRVMPLHWYKVYRFQWETGCRISEALNLTNDCVEFPLVRFREHRLPNGSMWRPKRPASVRSIRLSPHLEDLFDVNDIMPTRLVFFPKLVKPFTLRAALNALQTAATIALVHLGRAVGTHDIRRARIVQALAAGADPNTVARAVGHASLSTTIGYIIHTPMIAALPPTNAEAIDNPVVADWAATLRPKNWRKA
jgi:integrase